MKPVNPMGKNSFEKLETAGILGPKLSDPEQQKQRIEARVKALENVEKHLAKVEMLMVDLHRKDRLKQLQALTTALKATDKLLASKELPQGVKSPISNCLNELRSLREGVFTLAATTKKALTLRATPDSKESITELIVTAKHRLEVLGTEFNLEEYYRKAGDSIKNTAKEATKIAPLENKPFLFARVPVVPADGGSSVVKLTQQGFRVDDISGYPVIHNQLVMGINTKRMFNDDAGEEKNKVAYMKSEKFHSMLLKEVHKLRAIAEQKLSTKLQLVSDKPYRFEGGVWFWLMPDNEIRSFAKTFPSKSVKVINWGFAFNSSKVKKPSKGSQ